VVAVNWDDAQAFCQWLTQKESEEGKLPQEMKYRLPSDEEWSWAAAMSAETGTTPEERHMKNNVHYPWGSGWPPSGKVGNFADESFHARFPNPDAQRPEITNSWIAGYTDGFVTTSPVGSFPANSLGLHDMAGNLFQWCEDWWDRGQKERVQRGGSWVTAYPTSLLSSFRNHAAPNLRSVHYGFRVVLAPASMTRGADSEKWIDGLAEWWIKANPEQKGWLSRESSGSRVVESKGITCGMHRDVALRVVVRGGAGADASKDVWSIALRYTPDQAKRSVAYYAGVGKSGRGRIKVDFDGKSTDLKRFDLPQGFSFDDSHIMEFRAKGDTLVLKLDGTEMARVLDDTIQAGGAAHFAGGPGTLIEKLEYAGLSGGPASAK
jgi:hypothetical protein